MLLDQSSYFCPTRIVLGAGSCNQINSFVAEYGARTIFFVVDPALLQTAFVTEALAVLGAAGAELDIFSEIEPDPSDTSVARALEVSPELGSELVVAIGGGSTIDVAKAVAIVSTNGGRIHDYEG